MKKLLAVAASLIGLLAPLSVVETAHADERRCVSEREFSDIRWTYPPAPKGRVTDHFDLKGDVIDRWYNSEGEDVVVAYRKCPEWGTGRAFVWYDNYSWDKLMRVYAVARNGQMNWRFVQ